MLNAVDKYLEAREKLKKVVKKIKSLPLDFDDVFYEVINGEKGLEKMTALFDLSCAKAIEKIFPWIKKEYKTTEEIMKLANTFYEETRDKMGGFIGLAQQHYSEIKEHFDEKEFKADFHKIYHENMLKNVRETDKKGKLSEFICFDSGLKNSFKKAAKNGLKFSILSHGHEKWIRGLLEEHSLINYIEKGLLWGFESFDFLHKRKTPKGIKRQAKIINDKYNIKPSEMAFVDDDPRNVAMALNGNGEEAGVEGLKGIVINKNLDNEVEEGNGRDYHFAVRNLKTLLDLFNEAKAEERIAKQQLEMQRQETEALCLTA